MAKYCNFCGMRIGTCDWCNKAFKPGQKITCIAGDAHIHTKCLAAYAIDKIEEYQDAARIVTKKPKASDDNVVLDEDDED